MNILIIYCHPSRDSFTYMAKEAFLKGITDAGNTYEISDLYEMGFNPVMPETEYMREAFYEENLEIPYDVQKEQEKIDRAESMVFVFPNFWTSAPALLEGWFQRVWTFGYAYGVKRMKSLDKAVFFMTMGGSKKEKVRQEQIDAIKCTMLGDRMHKRANQTEFYVYDEMTRGYGNDENRQKRIERFCKEIYQIGYDF